jgi:hypothetical protein
MIWMTATSPLLLTVHAAIPELPPLLVGKRNMLPCKKRKQSQNSAQALHNPSTRDNLLLTGYSDTSMHRPVLTKKNGTLTIAIIPISKGYLFLTCLESSGIASNYLFPFIHNMFVVALFEYCWTSIELQKRSFRPDMSVRGVGIRHNQQHSK